MGMSYKEAAEVLRNPVDGLKVIMLDGEPEVGLTSDYCSAIEVALEALEHAEELEKKYAAAVEMAAIATEKAADSEPVVRGKWEVVHGVLTPGGDPLLRCPFCRSRESEHLCGIEVTVDWDYCPKCGAKLEVADA